MEHQDFSPPDNDAEFVLLASPAQGLMIKGDLCERFLASVKPVLGESGVKKKADDSLMARWRDGDQQAAGELFHRYANRLIALARSRLSAKLSRRIDAEDVVQSAYRSFFGDARDGRYDLQPGADLWKLLVTIMLHKLQLQVQRNLRQKRSMDREQNFGSEDSLVGIQADVFARDPSPVEAVALSDELEQLMRSLEPLERRMFELRLQGRDLEEIATATDRTERTVIRVLGRIKERLEKLQLDR